MNQGVSEEYKLFCNIMMNPSKKHIRKFLEGNYDCYYKNKVIERHWNKLSKQAMVKCLFLEIDEKLKNFLKEKINAFDN